jgi:hypothetical protein
LNEKEKLQRDVLKEATKHERLKAASNASKEIEKTNSDKVKLLKKLLEKKNQSIARLKEQVESKPKGVSKSDFEIKKAELKNESLLLQKEVRALTLNHKLEKMTRRLNYKSLFLEQRMRTKWRQKGRNETLPNQRRRLASVT